MITNPSNLRKKYPMNTSKTILICVRLPRVDILAMVSPWCFIPPWLKRMRERERERERERVREIERERLREWKRERVLVRAREAERDRQRERKWKRGRENEGVCEGERERVWERERKKRDKQYCWPCQLKMGDWKIWRSDLCRWKKIATLNFWWMDSGPDPIKILSP